MAKRDFEGALSKTVRAAAAPTPEDRFARADAFLEESRWMGQLLGSKNQIEAVTAEMERRPPDFGPATLD